MKLAQRLDAVKPSPTLAITAKAREMKSKGIDVVGFGAGEPDFDTPALVKDAAKLALDQGFTKYTPTNGIPELREAIAATVKRDHGIVYAPNEVLVSCGGKHALYNLFQALLNDGDEVVIFAPYWVSYADMVRVSGGKPVIVETTVEQGFDPSVAQIEGAFSPRTKAVILNSPSNPTGAMLSRRTLETVIRLAKGKDVTLVSDDSVAVDFPDMQIVIFAPYWVSYADMVRVSGGKPVIVETTVEQGFDPSVAQIEGAFSPRTKAVILNSPSNPTGAMLSRRTLETVIRLAKGKDVTLVSDDIYDRLVYRGKFENVLDLDPSLRGQVALVNGASKTFAMTGWRIGWTAGPQPLIAAMQKLQDNSTSNATSIAQKAALAALTLPGVDAEVEKMRVTFDGRRKHMVARLNAVPGMRCFDPAGAFYAFPNVTALLGQKAPGATAPLGTDTALSDLLLEKHQVAVVPGSAFGAPGHLRLSFATSMEQIDKGCDRILEMAKSLS